MTLKILHTADWHLGKRFPAFDDADQIKLTRARLEVIDRILAEAEKHRVDAVLCAGDQFDNPDPERDWWDGLIKTFQRWSAPRPVFLLPGNHDPLTPKSVYHPGHPFRQSLPSWVHVVDRPNFTHELSANAVLFASPCTSQAGHDDLAMALPAREPGDDRIRIGLVHGQTFDMPGLQTNYPISSSAAQQRGLDYLALGDTHSFREVPAGVAPVADVVAPTVYSGTPEPTHFSETGAGHVALVFFRRHATRPLIQQIKVGRWTWRDERHTDLSSLRRLREESSLATTVLRLDLDLTVSLPEFDELETLLAELKGTEAAAGHVGVLQVERRQLRESAELDEAFTNALPPALQKTIARLRRHENHEVANRALYHLFKLARGTAGG